VSIKRSSGDTADIGRDSPAGFLFTSESLSFIADSAHEGLSTTFAERALVFGNDLYDPKHGTSLTCCVNDAKEMARALESRGFTVKLVLNASAEEMSDESYAFGKTRTPDDTAVIFYAGHGSEVRCS
jgi:hypothetical protein